MSTVAFDQSGKIRSLKTLAKGLTSVDIELAVTRFESLNRGLLQII